MPKRSRRLGDFYLFACFKKEMMTNGYLILFPYLYGQPLPVPELPCPMSRRGLFSVGLPTWTKVRDAASGSPLPRTTSGDRSSGGREGKFRGLLVFVDIGGRLVWLDCCQEIGKEKLDCPNALILYLY